MPSPPVSVFLSGAGGADDEDRREHRSGDQTDGGHGYFLADQHPPSGGQFPTGTVCVLSFGLLSWCPWT
jgi:hypothetical protein